MFWSALEVQDLSVGADLWVSTTSPQCQQMPRRWERYSYGNWKFKEGSVAYVPDGTFLSCPSSLQLQNKTQSCRARRKAGLDMGSFMMEAPSLHISSC